MKLVTFQSIDALKSLINKGYLECNEKYIDEKKAGPTYQWILEKMNQSVENKYNVKAYSSSIESFICNNPILEPSLLYSAAPVKELKNHLLMAKPSHSLDINELDIPGIEVLDLKGHAIGQIGILTSDDVLFTGDAYTSSKILEKYAIQYNYDIEEYINTLDYLLTTDYKYYVPSHGEVEKNCTNTVMINKENALKIEDYLLKILQEEKSFSNLLSQVFADYHINNNLMQYHLIGSTIKAFLTKLNNARRVEIIPSLFLVILLISLMNGEGLLFS